MQHRAPRPLLDAWRRLPRATARRLWPGADHGRTRVLAPLLAAALAIGGYAGLVSLTGERSTPEAGSSAPTATHDADGSLPTEPPGESDDSAPRPDDEPTGPPSPEPSGPPSSVPSATPTPASDASPSVPPEPGEVTRPRSTGSATPSTSPSSPGASAAVEDETPPSTALTTAYPEPDAAEFSFSANEGASFACSLDGAPYVSCDSPRLYSDLSPGWHTFAVRATDTAGNTDPTPAETRWKAKNAHTGDAEGG